MDRQDTIGCLRLVSRSAKNADAEGWISVSRQLTAYIETSPDDLVEKKVVGENLYVRLTGGGDIVLKYA